MRQAVPFSINTNFGIPSGGIVVGVTSVVVVLVVVSGVVVVVVVVSGVIVLVVVVVVVLFFHSSERVTFAKANEIKTIRTIIELFDPSLTKQCEPDEHHPEVFTKLLPDLKDVELVPINNLKRQSRVST